MTFVNNITFLSAIALLLACSNKSTVQEPPPPVAGVNDTSSDKVVYWLTTPDETSLLKRQPALAYVSGTTSTININIDTTQTFQEMDGFGYTLTGGSASLIYQMSAESRADLLNELFGNNDNSIHVSYLRISIGASDLSADVYTYDDMMMICRRDKPIRTSTTSPSIVIKVI
jgi:glucosylceramidase